MHLDSEGCTPLLVSPPSPFTSVFLWVMLLLGFVCLVVSFCVCCLFACLLLSLFPSNFFCRSSDISVSGNLQISVWRGLSGFFFMAFK